MAIAEIPAVHELSLKSVVRGYHVYMRIWDPVIGDILACKQERDNDEDEFAVAVCPIESLDSLIVGHIPREISRICWYFLEEGGSILCEISGRRQYSRDLIRGGLQIPCLYHFWHNNRRVIRRLHVLL